MTGAVKRFPDLVAAAAETDTDLLVIKQTVGTADAEPVKWTLAACWTWIVAKITANAATVRTALGLATVASSGSASDLGSGTLPAARLPNPSSSTLGGVQSKAAVSHQFLTSISTSGVPALAQPDVTDVTGAAALASPTFTGTPAGPTAAVDTSTTQLATTAMVLAQAAAATPLMDGTAAVGTSTRFARADHVHATDTTLYVHPGYVAGRWYWPNSELVSAGSAPGANTIKLVPFMLLRPVTMSDLAIKIATADAAGNAQVAIYNSNPTTHLPTTVAASTGNISTASAVVVSADITGADVLLVPGLYWQAINTSSASAAFMSVHPSSTIPGFLIGTTTLANLVSSSTALLVRQFNQTFGTWPDLTGQTVTENLGAIGAIVGFKAA